jgi:hypothetical protein
MVATKENVTRGLTASLAVIGTLLAIADQIKDIPALADYSQYGTAFIGFAIAAKQICMVAFEAITGKPWVEPKKE